MKSTDDTSKSNDYALAKKLDTTATYLIHGLCDMLRHLEYVDYDDEYYRIIKDANRAYILLVHELDATKLGRGYRITEQAIQDFLARRTKGKTK